MLAKTDEDSDVNQNKSNHLKERTNPQIAVESKPYNQQVIELT